MAFLLKFVLIIVLSLLTTSPVFALDFDRPNNKVGIHLAVPEDEDLDRAAELVNSTGGKWGYVTLVLQENDLSKGKWQEVFNKLRKLKLIPIVRLATQPEGDKWRRPTEEDADKYANFLDSLNWVVKDRYVVLFNEPNHGAEWGGAVDAVDYAKTVLNFARKFKQKNSDFFLMLAGLDASAPHAPPTFQDETYFLQQTLTVSPELFSENLINGLASHSYPNPGFSGDPFDTGKGTVRTYEWELAYIKSLGVDKQLPVFITETGWSRGSLSEEVVADFIRRAFENVWLSDRRVRAVTPFILNYQTDPFMHFSYKKFQSDAFYKQFHETKAITKNSGDPEVLEKGEVIADLPYELTVGSNYRFKIRLKNRGQAIWDKADGYTLKLEGQELDAHFFSDLQDINPFEEGEADFFLKTGDRPRNVKTLSVALYKKDQKLFESKPWSFALAPLPKVGFKVKLFPKLKPAEGDKFELQIFDQSQELVFRKRNIKVENGQGLVNNIRNVYLGGKYRLVLLNPYYLPRQTHLTLKKEGNEVKFERMLPLDFDRDGNLDLSDIGALFKNPRLFGLIFP